MKIGIDASRLGEKNRSGTQNFLFELIKRLALLDTKNKYVIYFDHAPTSEFVSQFITQNPNFTCKHLKKMLSWTQISLAFETFRHPVAVLLLPWQTMPIIHKSNTKLVSIVHGLEYKKLRFGPTFYTCLFSDHLVAVSEFTKKEIIKQFKVSGSKISVIYEAVNKETFYKRSSIEIEKVKKTFGIEGDYIFFVGYMVHRKNIERMLGAFKKLIESGGLQKKYSFILAGKVPSESAHIYELPSKYGIENNVKFIGRVGEHELPALISGASLLCYVSLSEGFGLPVLEAMACETPVLTSTGGALPEVSADAAVLVDPYDIDQIFEGMSKVLSSGGFSANLVAKGLKNVERFNWETTAKGILDVILKL